MGRRGPAPTPTAIKKLLSKAKSRGRIDGIVAAIGALRVSMAIDPPGPSEDWTPPYLEGRF